MFYNIPRIIHYILQLLKEKEELNNSVIELKNQLAEMEIKQHAAEKAKEPKPMKNQEVVACLSINF